MYDILEKLKEVKFRIGERRWCIECSDRIIDWIKLELKGVKNEKK